MLGCIGLNENGRQTWGAFTVHSGNQLPSVDAKRGRQAPYVQLLVKLFRYRSRGILIVLDNPLQGKAPLNQGSSSKIRKF